MWFNSPQRFAYLHVVEKAKIVLESLSTHSSSLTHHQGDGLRFPLRCWVITDFPMARRKHESTLGNASHLGGFPSKGNECTMNVGKAQQVLKLDLLYICSLALNRLSKY
jgi:hypothetical protein